MQERILQIKIQGGIDYEGINHNIMAMNANRH